MRCAQQVAADSKQILHGTAHQQEAVRVFDRLESVARAFALPRWLMRDLRSVVLVPLCAVCCVLWTTDDITVRCAAE